ncbi:MAG: BREX system ATP-binding domain-containing protein [Pseudomonadota bacterium]
MTELTPSRIGQYEILKRLARGGMGEIYLARQLGIAGFERLVIVKTMLSDLASESHTVDQFFDEARLAANLNHPNVVSTFELGRSEQRYYIAMEYIHGVNLAELEAQVRSRGARIPPRVGAAMLRSAALGLDYAHHAVDLSGRPMQVVHRDVSPQNLMVRLDGGVKVVDFGIAHATNRFVKTEHNAIKGKLLYLSPEQVRGEPLTEASDQFSLGSVAWRLFTGSPLFKGDNPGETMYRIVTAPVPSLCEMVEGFPGELDAVIQRMLQRQPQARYADCGAAARALQAYLDGSGGNADHEVADFVQQNAGTLIAARALVSAGDSSTMATLVTETASLTSEPVVKEVIQESTLVNCAACLRSQSPHNLRCEHCGALLIGDTSTGPVDGVDVSSVFRSLPSLSLDVMRSSVSQRPELAADDGDPWEIPATKVDGVLRASGGTKLNEFGEALQSVVLDLGAQQRGTRGDPSEAALVGRSEAVSQVQQALAQARAGTACGLLVLGQSGMGKTFLAREVNRLAVEQGFATCHAIALRRGVPLAMDLFRQWVMGVALAFAPEPRKHGLTLVATVADALQAMPSELLTPCLQQRLVQLFDGLGGETSTTPMAHAQRMATAAVQFLGQVATRQPLLLIADDVHDVDEPSQLLLRSLLKRLPRSNLCVLATGLPGIVDVIADDLHRLELEPLDPQDSQGLVRQAIAERDWPAGLDDAVAQASGNPGVLAMQVRALMLEGYVGPLRRRGPKSLHPDHALGTIEGCSHWLVQRLGRTSLEVMQSAALHGSVFSSEILIRTCGGAAAVRTALAEAVRLGLVHGVATGAAVFLFTQSSWRQSLLATLASEAREGLRATYAVELHRTGGALPRDDLEVLASLPSTPNTFDVPTMALRARAARVLLHQGITTQAHGHLSSILEQAAQAFSASQPATGEACDVLLHVAAQAGLIDQHREPERGSAAIQLVLDLTAPSEAPRERALALWYLAQCHRSAHRRAEAVDAIEQSQLCASTLQDPALQATLDVEQALLLWASGEQRQGIFLLAAALERLGQVPIGNDETLATRQLQLAMVYRFLARLYHLLENDGLAVKAAQRALEMGMAASQLHEEVAGAVLLGEFERDRVRAATLLDATLQRVQTSDDPWLGAELQVVCGRALQSVEPRAAAELFLQARAAAVLSDRRDIFTSRGGDVLADPTATRLAVF